VSRGARIALVQGGASLVAAGCALALALTSDHSHPSTLDALLGELVGLSFTTAGLLGTWRRPGNRSGVLLSLVGFLYFAGALAFANASLPSSIGWALQEVFLAAFVHLLLAYPAGTLTRGAKRVVVFAYASALGFPLLYLLVAAEQPGCSDCPPSAFTIVDSSSAQDVLSVVAAVSAIVIAAATVILLVRRWRAASPVYRSSFRLVLLTGALAIALIGAQLIVNPFLGSLGRTIFSAVGGVAFLLVPFAFAAGLLRGRFASAAVGRLLAQLGPVPAPGRLRDSLREALGDPGLELGYWLPDLPGYVDIEGRPFDPADLGASTPVDGENGRVGVLVHDPALLDQRELLDGVVSAARLALENERLHAELRAQLDALARERDFTRLVVNTAPSFFCVLDGEGRIVRFNETLARTSGILDDDRTRGRKFWDVFTLPEEAPDVRGLIALTAATGRGSRQESRLLAADGIRRTVEWVTASIPDERGQFEYVLVCGLDVTEQTWHDNVQGSLRRVATLVAAGTGEAELMSAVTSEIGRLFEGQSANLLQLGEDGFLIVGAWSSGEALTWEPGTLFPVVGDTASGRAIASLRPERVDSPEDLADEVARELWAKHGTHAAVAAPVIVDRALWGVISVSRVTTERYPPEAEDRLGDFAALVAQAIANAAARAEVRASRARLVATADAERKKLERNLHDGAQQRLVSVSISLRLAQAKLVSAPADAGALIGGAAEELALALVELRELARGIHPAVLTDRGLAPALGALADRAPLPVLIESDLDERLPSVVEAAAYYVVAESLTNVAKYAGASSASVRIQRLNGNAVVEVRDDGVGGADPTLGSGLRGLADRVEALNGRLGVESESGGGTRVWAEIPCV
jgi:PAS domain S-box-containing protein